MALSRQFQYLRELHLYMATEGRPYGEHYRTFDGVVLSCCDAHEPAAKGKK